MLLDTKNRDFIHVNDKGMSVISLGSRYQNINDNKLYRDKREYIDDMNERKMLHTLESINFLKLDVQNYIKI